MYKNEEHPMLIGQAGPLNGERWELERELLIGRDSSCDIVIPVREASRYHARLIKDQQGVLLEDLDSKNGTFRNGERIEEPIYLLDGDMVQIALVQGFVFLSSDSTLPLDLDELNTQSMPVLRIDNKGILRVDIRARRVFVRDVELDPPLSGNQFRLLEQLYAAPGEVVTRAQLITAVWGEDALGISEQALDALVRRLRERLAEVETEHDFVVTVRGHGLRLENPRKDEE
ncbi:MAG: FHA domain-containing protein [Anaerolineae bacterium]|jgi:pSer/pThr/pTyr-binding forkhead associated (FHA) protein|nr:FHA domain-containing protein [Anaerolineae bacterium]